MAREKGITRGGICPWSPVQGCHSQSAPAPKSHEQGQKGVRSGTQPPSITQRCQDVPWHSLYWAVLPQLIKLDDFMQPQIPPQ